MGRSCRRFTMKDAEKVARKIGLPEGVTTKALLRGMNVEREHADVTRCNAVLTGRIAKAHLGERPDYYERLSRYVEG